MDGSERMTLPNFIVIGQMKAGTSSLNNYLSEHPDIFTPTALKETRFFNLDFEDPQRPSHVKPGLPVTIEQYCALFSEAGNQSAIGEVSPQYLESPYAARQISAHLPQVRIIASLRNPVDRLYSLYQMEVRNRRESRPFLTAFRTGKAYPWVKNAFVHQHLLRYFEQFRADAIHVLLFERLVREPGAVMAETYDFLGVDCAFQGDYGQVHNKGGLPKSQMVFQFGRLLTQSPSMKQTLKDWLPDGLINAGRRVRDGNLEKAPALDAEARAEVAADYREDVMKVQDLTGLDLGPWWPDFA